MITSFTNTNNNTHKSRSPFSFDHRGNRFNLVRFRAFALSLDGQSRRNHRLIKTIKLVKVFAQHSLPRMVKCSSLRMSKIQICHAK